MRPFSALILAGALIAPAAAQAQTQRFTFNEASQPLANTLLALSARSGTAVLAPAALTTGLRAPAVVGVLSLEEALQRALRDTRLTWRRTSAGVVLIEPMRPSVRTAEPKPAPRWTPDDLAPVELTAVMVVARPLGEPGLPTDQASAAQIDVLTGGDIQRLGAVSIGEALQHLPGVSASSEFGEPRQVSIRGVGSRFTRVRVNGMEALATFGATNANGGTNRARAFDFNVFAADLFEQVRLQKTASADVDEGSLGATVDMRTRSPWDLPPRSAAFVVEHGYNTLARRSGGRLSGVVSARDPSDRFGALFSAAFSNRSVVESGTTAGQWESGQAVFPGFGSAAAPLSLAALNSALHARIPRLEFMRVEQERLGLTGALEWRPSNTTRVGLDVLYAELRSERQEDLLESFTFRTAGACGAGPQPTCGLNAVDVREGLIAPYGGRVPVLIAGRFDNVDVRSESRRDELNTIFRQVTLSATHQFTSDLKGSLLAGFSRSDFSNPVQDTFHLEQYDVDGFAYDFRDDLRPVLEFGDLDATDPAAWRLSEIRSDPNWVDNSFRTLALDFEGALGALAWRAGALHKTYRTTAVTLSLSDGGVANLNSDVPPEMAALPVALYARLAGVGESFGARGAPGAWITADTRAALAAYREACAASPTCQGLQLGPGPTAGLNYDVRELTDAVYLQIAAPHHPGRRFWGEAGLRLVRTRQRSTGLEVKPDASVGSRSAERDYWEALPSFNFAWRPSEPAIVRLGAARVMARPDMALLRPGITVGTTGTKFVSSGSPDLEPTLATTLDAAVEWTPRPGALLALALYRKTIRSTVQWAYTRQAVFAANPFGLPDAVGEETCGSMPGCSAALPIWQFARPTNTGPGELNGIEVSFRTPPTPADRWAGRWSATGAFAYTRTSIEFLNKDGLWEPIDDALGGPRTSAQFSLTYRRPALEVRGAVNHAGAQLVTIPAPSGGDVDGVNAITVVDLAARLRLSDRIWLTAQATNLTDAIQRQFSDRTGIPNYQHRVGREFRLGLRITP